MKQIHINCDLGEGGKYDAELMPLISACNIACGGHAGNLETMLETVKIALANHVDIGAHPSYPDKENFGRKSLQIPAQELKRSIIAQVLSLKQIVEAEGGKLSHIKPHGALYNQAAKDEKIAEVILESVAEFDESIPLFVPPDSVIAEQAKGRFPVIFEAFADRNYTGNLRLVSRAKSNALITQKEAVFDHLFSMFSQGKIPLENGEKIGVKAETFCLHSDTPDAVKILRFLHRKFGEKNIKIKNTDE